MPRMATMGRPPTLPEPWASLAASVGGVDVLATCLGVNRRTIHRWATGAAIPGRLTREGVDRFAATKGLAPPYHRR